MKTSNGNGKGLAIAIAALLVALMVAVGTLAVEKLPAQGGQPVPCSACITPVPIVSVVPVKATLTPTGIPVPLATEVQTVPVPISTSGVQLVSMPVNGGGSDCATSVAAGQEHISVDWPLGALDPIDVFAGPAPSEDIFGVVSCGDGRYVNYAWLAGVSKASFNWGGGPASK